MFAFNNLVSYLTKPMPPLTLLAKLWGGIWVYSMFIILSMSSEQTLFMERNHRLRMGYHEC